MQPIIDIIDIARTAGDAILRIYEQGAVDVEYKSDDSPLTIADRTAHKIISAGLPLYPVISEESTEIQYHIRKDYETFWLVDPLDGTKEFIRRNGEFTVNIALIHQEAPVFGIIHVPVSGDIYWASRGNGAFYETPTDRQRLQCAEFSMSDRGLQVVCSRSHMNTDTQAYVDTLDTPQLISRGSALKFMLLSEGAAHLYPRLAPTMEWDTAAAQCIVEEAGGFVVDFNTRQPLLYNKQSLVNPFFLAGGKIRK